MIRGFRAGSGRRSPRALAVTLTATLAATPLATTAAPAIAHPAAAHAATAQVRADEVRAAQWYLDAMGVTEAHQITQGEGQVIAVLDSGVNQNFPDLAGSVLPGVDTWTRDRKGWVTENSHGTKVSAIAAGHGHGAGGAAGILGIAPKAKILPMGVWPPGQLGSRAKDLAVSIRYVTDHGATVILVAGGGSGDDSLTAAVKYAYDRGVPVVASAGNPDDATIIAPASCNEAIAISGTNRKGDWASNASVWAHGIDFAAPATDIMVPNDKDSGYYPGNGTSFSSAIAAGAVALLRSRYPSLSAEQIFQQLKDTAVDKGDPGYDVKYGWGSIDLMAALTTPPGSKPTASATPRSTFTPPPPIADEGRSLGTKLGITIAAVAGFLLVVGGLVALVVRAAVRRRRRSGAPA
ncbi:S8 family serine peptidase [Rhizomonospora bruguierae]|uniref:S8 family serine peptidase n=1 Tax=Rhizomonospora bruguierae TaxID=1581705 RepID=UPI001BD1848E|nr:S8 family serine peptidase [Micromonospora sp. NBRC 107566]